MVRSSRSRTGRGQDGGPQRVAEGEGHGHSRSSGRALVRVKVVAGRHEGLLDRSRGGPAQQVLRGAGLVVGAGGTGAAERLLPDDRAGRLVVDVEVAGGEPQRMVSFGDGRPVLGDDGAGQAVRAALVDQAQRVGEGAGAGVVVHVHRQDRPEVLGAERLIGRVLAEQHGRLHEEAFGVVVGATGGDREAVGRLGPVHGRGVAVEGSLVDHRTPEVGEVGDVAVAQVGDLAKEVITHPPPHRLRHERAGGGRALLALVVEGSPDQRRGQHLRIGGGVRDDEVLAAGLPDQPRVAVVAAQVVADLLPQGLEGGGRAGEVDAGQPSGRSAPRRRPADRRRTPG